MELSPTDLEALKEKAENGEADSQLALARHYLLQSSYDINASGQREPKAQALYWCEKAANQDNPDAQNQMYLILSGYGSSYDENLRALSWLKVAAKNGCKDAHVNLGYLYENGFRYYDEIKKENVTILSKDYTKAAYCYNKSCDSHAYCASGLGYLLLEGKGITKNYHKGLKYLLTSICLGIDEDSAYFIMKKISELYANGKGVKKNHIESYIWALMNKAIWVAIRDFPDDAFIEELEKQLSLEEIMSAQNEAEKREMLRKNNDLTVDYCLATNRHGTAPTDLRSEIKEESVTNEILPSNSGDTILQAWNVSDSGKVIIHVNVKEKNIVVRYGKKSARYGIRKLFSPCCIELLLAYDKHANDHHEPAVSYLGNSIASVLNQTRSNQNVVSDFNSQFRSLFGLEKQAKAFTWLPGTKGRKQDKSLKIHFQLKVNYRV